MDRFTIVMAISMIPTTIAFYKHTRKEKEDAIFWMLVAILDILCAFLIKYQQINNIL